jgi:hypothetical protein
LLCDGYEKELFPLKNHYLIKNLSQFLITLKSKNNLYEFNHPKRSVQDEGIGSVWAGIALIKSYQILRQQIYLDEAISTYEAILNHLYSPETGLVHTAGQDFWCINASSKLAYLCSLILKFNYSEEIKKVMVNSINICTNNIADDGHFPYTKIHPGVYILLYHPSVIFYLEKCLESEYLNDKYKLNVIDTSKKAITYLHKYLDNLGRFNEPELKDYNFYIISAVTALAAIAGKIENEAENKILNHILKYYNHNKLYLFIDKNNRLFNGSRFQYKDSFTVEIFYWLTQYLYRS